MKPGLTRNAALQRWAPAVMAGVMLGTAGTIIVPFGLPAWAWIAPVVALGFALVGPRPGWAGPRDAFAILCLLTIFLRVFVPHEWPREIRYALGVPPGAGIVLLFAAYLFGDGMGAAMRRIGGGRWGEATRRIQHMGYRAFVLLIEVGGVLATLSRPTTPRWWAVLPIVMIVAGLLPTRWKSVAQGMLVVGCLPVPILGLGVLLGWWSAGVPLFVLFSLGLAPSIEAFREPIPERTPSVVEAERDRAVASV